jgi:hypothetical protein
MHTAGTIHTLRIFWSPSQFRVTISFCRRPDGKVHDSENSALGQALFGGEQGEPIILEMLVAGAKMIVQTSTNSVESVLFQRAPARKKDPCCGAVRR